GGGASYANRARVVSFDKPYPYHWAAGSAGWIGTEFSFLMLAERHGLDLAYLTDVDMHARPESIQAHQCLVSLGHDEYWSKAMRDGALAALDKGVNFAFLGANACYRHIRLEDSPVGPYRREVCYKDGPEDPLYGVDNADVTANWYDGPDSWAESNLVGSMYQCYGGSGDMVIVDPGSWLLHGTGLAAGDRIVKVIGSEFDACAPALGSPSNIRIVSHAPTPSAIGNWYSDMTWFTSQKPGGGGVFASGTMNFIPFLWDNPGTLPTSWAFDAIPGATKQLEQITLNVLAVTGEGPASRTFPSEPNWESYYKPTDTGLTGGEK
ncbi:MAG TPA: N,N-dimethylformamidase beta subunit family domain-containing protein, partial [Acidimicrobiales bacterium]|nr:N,N-dimethylformamidase beta subunit family domain-containing protein [Acidimicrobiales bacterium]